MSNLTGMVAIVTGAAGGIGTGIVRGYLEAGARVVAVDRSAEALAKFDDVAGRVLPVVADVASWEGNNSVAEAAVERFGRINIFVGNAGVTDAGTSLEHADPEAISAAFDELFAVNVKGLLLGAKACLPQLIENRGSVILTASFASSHAAGGGFLYTPSKHAVLGITRQLAYELAPDVRVNAVAPGVAPTQLKGLNAFDQGLTQSVYDGTAQILPLGRVPESKDYAGPFLFLADPAMSGMMTGAMVQADSGLSVRGISQPAGRHRTE